MKKFAAIFAAVILTVSVFMVSASAKLFSDSSVYKYSTSISSLPGSESLAISCYKFEVVRSGSVIFSFGFDDETLVIRNVYYSPDNIIIEPEFYIVVNGSISSSVSSPVPLRASDSFVYYSSVSGQSVGSVVSSTESAAVSSLGSSIFDVGDSLISFVTGSWLTLVALGAFVVVLCFGAIRRLVKGV